MSFVDEAKVPGKARRLAHKVLMWSGIASGVALTLMLSSIAVLTQGHHRGLVVVMILANIVMMVPWQRWPMPQWFDSALAVGRGFHWFVNLVFATLGLLLLAHAGHPKHALAFATLAAMFVLWAATARRLTHRETPAQPELASTAT